MRRSRWNWRWRADSGLTLPNPRVGAVLVRGGKDHRRGLSSTRGRAPCRSPCRRRREKAGAFRRRRDPLRHAGTLFDPGPHAALHGVDLAAKKSRASFCRDRSEPGPRGRGRCGCCARAGVEVSSGLLADEATALNRDFNWWIVHRRPWVVAKIALSLDGRIVTPPRTHACRPLADFPRRA
jgi:diaminohydroxyphosphoribosylaminopyrimidine deaminase/5-amino-6-(5-phosphoribosylamino)uracil reductase